MDRYVQRDQPPGVPPLVLDGERTLPDIPQENYWFRRHLVVYEWIAAHVEGRTVVDLACGEGYGSACLAQTAGDVLGVEANPMAFEHARLRYVRANLRFERAAVEVVDVVAADAIVLLQTIEHLVDPDAVLARIARLLRPGGTAYVSTPNVLTLAPAGAQRSDNPWHLREYRAGELEALCARHFASVQMLGVYHARKLSWHELALRYLGWDAIHAKLRLTAPFYDRFVPAISTRDFVLRDDRDLDRALDFVAVLRP